MLSDSPTVNGHSNVAQSVKLHHSTLTAVVVLALMIGMLHYWDVIVRENKKVLLLKGYSSR